MTASGPLLEIRNLETSFFTFSGEVKAVRDVSLTIARGEILGIVGESGSGKSVTALSVTRLLPDNGRVMGGQVLFEGEDLLKKDERAMRRIRNGGIAMIFQDPMTSLNPTIRVGTQIAERILAFGKGISKAEAWSQAADLLRQVKIPEPEKRVDAYPFELSGGMRQREMIAIAIATKPRLVIADEPTTALDVTIQNQILKLIRGLRDKIDSSILLITHDLGVVAETCQRVAVMYGGKLMEEGLVGEIFYQTAHPYTAGLKRSLPRVDQMSDEPLYSIAGSPPSLLHPPTGCPFAARCARAMRVCDEQLPPMFQLTPTHRAMCWLHHPDCPGKGAPTA